MSRTLTAGAWIGAIIIVGLLLNAWRVDTIYVNDHTIIQRDRFTNYIRRCVEHDMGFYCFAWE